MPGPVHKIGVSLAAAALAILTAASPATAETAASAARQAEPAAYFVMTDVTDEQFVIQLTDPDKIQHARDLLSGATLDRPHVIGRIAKWPVPYNPRWSYHYQPETVNFFDNAIEVCDATIPYVEDHLDEAGGAFLPGLVWCPWSSRLVRELPAR
ncbi:BP74-related protein [Microtetraspora malaysiensis]|uniref:Calmodulin-binding protein n=1 Tax=Microtetraspora malaysiensis TaxID=161358 RepID=A0ABW6T1W4_9ACTN